MDETEGLWVRSEVLPDGSYAVGLSVGGDRAWTLTRDAAVAYAVACFARATQAEHDAAVFSLLVKIVLSKQVAAAMIMKEIRPDRPEDTRRRSRCGSTSRSGSEADRS